MLLIGFFFFWNDNYNVLNYDVAGYQSYLPLIFENHSFNVNLDYFAAINAKYDYSSSLYQYVELPNGNVFIKYTMGWAILYLPFYLIAEVWVYIVGGTHDGFSFPYQMMAYIGSFVYFVISVFLLRKVLLLYFNDKITAIVLLIIGLGTNYFFMYYKAIGVTHNIEFVLVCFLSSNA